MNQPTSVEADGVGDGTARGVPVERCMSIQWVLEIGCETRVDMEITLCN